MIDFLKDNSFIPLYAITLVVCLIRYRIYYDSVLKYFPIIITYTLLSEVLGFFIKDFDSFQIIYQEAYYNANYFIFNIYDLVFFSYFYYLFWRVCSLKINKSIIKYGAVIYLLSACINPFFQNVYIFPQIYASTTGSIALVIAILLYFKEVWNKENKRHNVILWIGAGLLLFNVFFPPISILGIYNTAIYVDFGLRKIHYLIIAIMYSCFIIGFWRMQRIKPIQNN